MSKYFKLLFFIWLLLKAHVSIAQLNGNFTIGSSGICDYKTINQAIDSLKLKGINGKVVFNLKSGTYNEQVIIPAINGSSAKNTITFQSEVKDSSSVVILYRPHLSNLNFTIQLAGVDYITFQHLTLKTSGSSLATVIEIDYGSCNNMFIRNSFIGSIPPFLSYSNSSDHAIIYSPSIFTSNDTANIFQENYFLGGIHAFYYCGRNSNKTEPSLEIINNTFKNQFGACLFLQYLDRPKISGNSISNDFFSFFGGINLVYCSNEIIINGNTINANNCFSGYGISLENINITRSNASIISNNFIRIHTNDTVNSVYYYSFAIGASYSDSLIIVNNSVYISGRTYNSSALWFGNNNKDIRIVNNILANFASGYTIFSVDTLSIGFYSNNNCLHTENLNPFRVMNYLMKKAEWQAFSFQDSASLQIDPEYFSSNNLHTLSTHLNGKALSSPSVLYDIDNEVRDTKYPDIGADEFDPLKLDISIEKIINPNAGLNCELLNNEFPTVLIVNKGTNSFNNFKIELILDNTSHLVETITDTIKAEDSLVYRFKSSLDLSASRKFKLLAYISDSNDLNPNNDSILILGNNILTIHHFPFLEDFENIKGSRSFFLIHNNQSFANIDTISPYHGEFSLHFQGRCPNIGWNGGATTNNFNAWEDNKSHHSEAISCIVDGNGVNHLRLSFRLRQTFSYNKNRSWFRVLINDTFQIKDLNGKKEFNPYSNNDSFSLLTFDLDSFIRTPFKITFQSSCLTSNNYYQQGDNVFIDNIQLFIPPKNDIGIANIYIPPGNSCGETLSPIILTIKNHGYNPQQSFLLSCLVKTPNGTYTFQDTFKRKLLPLKSDTINIGEINTLMYGGYTFKAFPIFVNDSNCYQNDTFLLNLQYLEVKKTPIIETFDGIDSLSNWNTYNMWIAYPGHHQLTSYSLSNSIWAEDTISYAFFKRKAGPIKNQSYLLFDYRIISNQYPFYGALLTNRDTLLALVSENCGRSWDTIFSLKTLQHQTSQALKNVKISLKKYENKDILFGFYFRSDSFNLNYLDIDSVVIASLPYLKINHDTGFCTNSSVLLNPEVKDSNLRFLWLNAITNDTLGFQKNLMIDSPGKYVLIISDSLGWKNYDTVIVTQYPIAKPEIIANDQICSGEQLTLIANNCDKYQWYSGDTSRKIIVKITADTTFYLSGWNKFQCAGIDSLRINSLPLPVIQTIQDTGICLGNIITVSASGGTKYLWDSGDTLSSLSIRVNKTLKLIVRGIDSFGCINFDTVNILALPLPIPNLGKDTTLCAWHKILLNPGDFEEYYWWNNSIDSVIFADSSGIGLDTLFAWVRVGNNHCFQTDSIQIIFDKCISLDKTFVISDVSIFPNPADDELYMQFPNKIQSKINLQIFSMDGKVMAAYNYYQSGTVFNIDLKNIPDGSYLLYLSGAQINYYKLLLIKH